MTTQIYFVRHAQSEATWADPSTRPLTAAGLVDRLQVRTFFQEKGLALQAAYCSPYRRSLATIQPTADYFQLPIQQDPRLRERINGQAPFDWAVYQRRWAEPDYHEVDGESLRMVQQRNVAALQDILAQHPQQKVLVGTHGTALSTLINYYRPAFGFEDFKRIINWLPAIVRFDFEGNDLQTIVEEFHLQK